MWRVNDFDIPIGQSQSNEIFQDIRPGNEIKSGLDTHACDYRRSTVYEAEVKYLMGLKFGQCARFWNENLFFTDLLPRLVIICGGLRRIRCLCYLDQAFSSTLGIDVPTYFLI